MADGHEGPPAKRPKINSPSASGGDGTSKFNSKQSFFISANESLCINSKN